MRVSLAAADDTGAVRQLAAHLGRVRLVYAPADQHPADRAEVSDDHHQAAAPERSCNRPK
jgi:hypothetical protein